MKFVFRMLVMSLLINAGERLAVLKTGDRLPALRGEFLSGRPAILPDAAAGKVGLLLLGFSYDSRFAVEAWAKRFRADFGSNPGVTFFEVPMIGGMARMGKWFIDRGMRRGTPKEDHEHVVTVYGGTDAWKDRTGFRDDKAAYVILIDDRGTVAWRHTGGVDLASYDALAAEVRRLLGRN
jgi:hypothetical protein